MPIFKREDLFGWESRQNGEFLCVDCFDKSSEKVENWRPVLRDEVEGEDKFFICDKGGEVVLLIPHDEGVFQLTVDLPGKPSLVSYAQLYVDLTRMSGRAPEQADVVRKKCLAFAEEPA